MMAESSIVVGDEATARFARLVASCSGVGTAPDVTVQDGADLSFPDTDERPSILGLAQYIVSLAPSGGQTLLGTGAEQGDQIAARVLASSCIAPLTSAQLEDLNDELASKTVLVGSHVTLADLALYSAAEPALTSADSGSSTMLGHALRWYDYIHNVADRAAISRGVTLAKPAYQPPAPAAAAVVAGKDGAGKGALSKSAADGGKESESAKDAPVPATSPACASSGKDKKAAKKEKKAGGGGGGEGVAPVADVEPSVDLLDLRVGRILDVARHPNADALYVETIDLGEAAPRQVVSGLVKFVAEEAMRDRLVVVVTNLKPAKMRDVMSFGMVLCASNDAHDAVDPIIPPPGVAVGERIRFKGFEAEPEAQLNPRKKQFEKIAPHLVTSSDGVCTYKGVPFMTSAGPVTATIPNAHIA